MFFGKEGDENGITLFGRTEHRTFKQIVWKNNKLL